MLNGSTKNDRLMSLGMSIRILKPRTIVKDHKIRYVHHCPTGIKVVIRIAKTASETLILASVSLTVCCWGLRTGLDSTKRFYFSICSFAWRRLATP